MGASGNASDVTSDASGTLLASISFSCTASPSGGGIVMCMALATSRTGDRHATREWLSSVPSRSSTLGLL